MTVPGNLSSPLLATGAAAGAAAAAGPIKSVRFDANDSNYMRRLPSSAGNRRTWTWAAWVKRGDLDASDPSMFSAGNSTLNVDLIRFDNSDRLDVLSAIGSINFRYVSSAKYVDPSAWLHIVVAIDTTNSTAADRVKIYVNGVRLTEFDTSTAPSLNYDTLVNSTINHSIGHDDGND